MAASLFLQSAQQPAVLAAAAVGGLFLARHVLGFLSVLYNAYLAPGKSIKRYTLNSGKTYAIITGASDGIGKEFALQLAKAKFNVVLLARTKSKLDAVAEEARGFGVEAIVFPFDFAKAGDKEYEALGNLLKPLEIGILVNNVGISHEIPVAFLEESEQVILDMVQINIVAQLRVTRLIAPKLVAQKKGLILNIGSVAGCIPSGLMATYSASKAFLRYWSQGLGMELAPHKVHVEHITTYFVVTAMSKIRRANWSTPTTKNYVRSVLAGVGKSLDSAPYPAHAILMWVLNTFTTVGMRLKQSNDLHISIRKRALKKREREAKKQHPHRGLLDNLATRCLSTGSNAYTAEDHTAYTLTNAGAVGLLHILPVFLDHVLNPTLTDEQFSTEVYHIDGVGKEQGVVFCEMAGRENTESDLLDISLRRLLYNGTTYAYECGGKTNEIRKLTNNDIRAYHRKHYDLNNVTIVLMGLINPEDVFKVLLKNLPLPRTSAHATHYTQPSEIPVTVPSLQTDVSEKVFFPSADESVGSVTYGWLGPKCDDINTIIALDILMTYLTDTSASPLYQAFVECEHPWATEVDFGMRNYVKTSLVLYFSGVPLMEHDGEDSAMDESATPEDEILDDAATDDEDEDWSDDDNDDDVSMEDMSGDDAGSEHSDSPHVDFFAEGVYKKQLYTVLREIVRKGISKKEIARTIGRYRRKVQEALEDDPHEVIANYLVPDITLFHLMTKLEKGESAESSAARKMLVGSRGKMFVILNQLLEENSQFWTNLLTTWLLNAPSAEVLTVPSLKLASDNASKEAAELERRCNELGEHGLAKKAEEAKDAFEKNKVNLSKEILDSFPPVQDIGDLPRLPCNVTTKSLPPSTAARKPYTHVQLVETETMFSFIRVSFGTADIPDNLRPYLVLFQELMFQSPIAVIEKGSIKKLIDYQTVIKECSELFVSFEAGVGFGNDLWSCTWLSEVCMLAASMEPKVMAQSVPLLFRILLFSQFTKERILSSLQKLLTDIAEVKRDGGSVLNSVVTRITGLHSGKKRDIRANDMEISIFRQEEFLKGLLKKIKSGKKGVKQVVDSLEAVRLNLISGPTTPGFLQLAMPMSDGNSTTEAVLAGINQAWDDEYSKYMLLKGQKMNNVARSHTPFPFPRQPYSLDHVDSLFTNGLLVPVKGISASYLSIVVPCDILGTKDFFAVSLLAEVLSRAEGPLYTTIRGKGLAYDASMHIAIWTGQLSFEVNESSDPRRAVVEFLDILVQLADPAGFDALACDFDVETAKTSVAYKLISSRSTSSGCISASLRGSLRVGSIICNLWSVLIIDFALQGFKSVEEELQHERLLYNITKSDLREAYLKYFRQFLDFKRRVTVVVTPAGDAVQKLKETFASVPGSDEVSHANEKDRQHFALDLRVTKLSELQLK
ncbi:hypothetical protein HDV05_003680 [Chytridiales sp. JEL 0842]|nr:hypothetical protein HDV05_003680 [Chytridiales sp. JEL 0842]